MQQIVVAFFSGLLFFAVVFSAGMSSPLSADSSQATNLQAPTTAKAPTISVPESTYDFGEVTEDGNISHDFTVKNTGEAPLEINQVRPG